MELLGATTSVETLWSRPVAKYVRDVLTQSSLGLEDIVGGMDPLPKGLAAKLSKLFRFAPRSWAFICPTGANLVYRSFTTGDNFRRTMTICFVGCLSVSCDDCG